jgi:hypothetical protein
MVEQHFCRIPAEEPASRSPAATLSNQGRRGGNLMCLKPIR